jgi:hypothetical protein
MENSFFQRGLKDLVTLSEMGAACRAATLERSERSEIESRAVKREIFHNGHYASIGSMLRPCRPKIESAIMMMKSAEDRHLMRALMSARPSVKMILVVFENLALIGQSAPDARFC